MSTYKWINQQSFKTQSTNILTFVNISRHESGTYACNVENNMTRSIGGTKEGKSNSQIILNILYPAIVNAIYAISIVEGTPFEIVCPVEYGNPANSTVTWSKRSDENRRNNIHLTFKNVSREDDANYTCSVITELHPTIVPSEVTKFTISTESSHRNFIVNKTQNLQFECIAEANPPSDLKIKYPKGDYIIEVSQSNIARHTLRNASFQDAGEYICTGRNNYTRGTPPQSKLILIVKSRPRPASGDTSAIKVVTVLNVDVTLLFTENHKGPDTDVNNSYQNVSGASTQQNSNDNEYEKIGLNVKYSENTVNGSSKCIEDMEENNDNPVTYEKLADDRKDLSKYSQLHSIKEKQDDYENDEKDEQHAELSKIYINIKI